MFDDDLRPGRPGSGDDRAAGDEPGGSRSATTRTSEKSAEAFVTVDGVRWALPGDMATVDADGTIRVLGRGSLCINTGGEKVYPEEVEAVLKAHDAVADALVVGVPDERWGQAVTAVVAPVAGVEWPGDDALDGVVPGVARRLQDPPALPRRRRGRALALGQGRLPLGPRRGLRRVSRGYGRMSVDAARHRCRRPRRRGPAADRRLGARPSARLRRGVRARRPGARTGPAIIEGRPWRTAYTPPPRRQQPPRRRRRACRRAGATRGSASTCSTAKGIDAAVLFGSSAQLFFLFERPDVAAALCRGYNDWLAEYCAHDPRRLVGCRRPAAAGPGARGRGARAGRDRATASSAGSSGPTGSTAAPSTTRPSTCCGRPPPASTCRSASTRPTSPASTPSAWTA